jgi:hypothetical protein
MIVGLLPAKRWALLGLALLLALLDRVLSYFLDIGALLPDLSGTTALLIVWAVN